MNGALVVSGLAELALSLMTGALVLGLSFLSFSFLTRGLDEVKEIRRNNPSVALVVSAFVVGVLVLVRNAMGPSLDVVTGLYNNSSLSLMVVLGTVLRFLTIYFVSAFFAFLLLWLTLRMFFWMTRRIDELKELRKNNGAVASVLSVYVLCMAFLFSDALSSVLNGLVSLPLETVPGTEGHLVNWPVVMKGLRGLVLASFGGLLVSWVGFGAFPLGGRRVVSEELRAANLAVSILVVGMLGSQTLLIHAAMGPAQDVLEFTLGLPRPGGGAFLGAGVRVVLFFGVAGLTAMGLMALSLKTTEVFTGRGTVISQIEGQNVALALVVTAMALCLTLVLERSLMVFLSGWMETPMVGRSGLGFP